jgi:hypothetical protein
MMGIARGRSCASISIVPRLKMTLVRALHGRAVMAGVGAPYGRSWESLLETRERGRGGGEGKRLGTPWGGMGRGCYWRRGLGPCCSLRLFSVRSLCLREEESMEREERKEKKRREGRKRNKKMGKILNMQIFRKNKR